MEGLVAGVDLTATRATAPQQRAILAHYERVAPLIALNFPHVALVFTFYPDGLGNKLLQLSRGPAAHRPLRAGAHLERPAHLSRLRRQHDPLLRAHRSRRRAFLDARPERPRRGRFRAHPAPSDRRRDADPTPRRAPPLPSRSPGARPRRDPALRRLGRRALHPLQRRTAIRTGPHLADEPP